MKVELNRKSKFFVTTEEEANRLVDEFKENTTGDISKQEIATKDHMQYGRYYEVTIEELFAKSNDILKG
ncbi:MAG: hypothetical protein PT939_00180 [Aerococcus suis]|nr:hypothetical protein [Aerococcus suis]